MECNRCYKKFSRAYTLRRHLSNSCVPIPNKRLKPSGVELLESGVSKLTHAFKNRIASYRFSGDKKVDYNDFLNEVKPKVLIKLQEYLQLHNALKVNFEVFGIYVKPEMSDIKSMNTSNKVITGSSDLHKIFEEFKDEITNQASEFQEKDSGWALQEIIFLDVNINRFSAISASSYIKLPKPITQKCAVLNIENHDNACFAWCVNAAIFPAKGDPRKPESYPPFDTLLQFDGIEFPVKLINISKFEQLNNISINVYGLESHFKDGKMKNEVVGPLHFTSERKPTHVNLLLITNNDGNGHYCLITDLSRLVSSQKTKHKGQIHFCDGCLQSFNSKEKLVRHEKHDCTHVCVELPTANVKINKCGELLPENILKFTNFEKQLRVPFVIYADFESLLKPIHHNEPCDGQSFSVKVCEHEPYSFAFYVKCSYDDNLSKLEIYEGPDAAKVFVQKLDEIVHYLYNRYLKHIVPMKPLTDEQIQRYENATSCHICERPFHELDKKVRDHCHMTGNYVNAAHNSCNLNYQLPKFIPVFFHNLSSYDAHLFIKELSTNGEPISAVAQTKEKYISFSKSILVEKYRNPEIKYKYIKLRFVDSFRFLASSLEKLGETLEDNQCKEIRKYFPLHFNLMRKKGIFPYSYVDCLEKLQEGLPTKDKFYDTLKGENISDSDYAKAQEIWNTFQCKTLSDYGQLYLKTDVLLLADIFENFRHVCLETYKLDPANYLTAPSLSWDAMLKYTRVELQLLTDVDMLHFFKKGIRGGVAQCSKRKAVANNRLLPNFDPMKPESYIAYLDATSLYGRAMESLLPSGDFRWLNENEITNFDVKNIADNSQKGYVLEVDLEYPTNLHDAHNDLPFCPENMIPPRSKYSKLIPNLYDKTNYIIHYQNLKQCLKYGLKLKKTHRVIEFSQSAWLKPYIELNTNLRNQARNVFEKDLFKLFINSIFGKTMENVEKRNNIHLASHWENKTKSLGARALIAKPEFKTCSVFNENLVAVHLNKVKVVYDKPVYVGFAILDISKIVIYEFFYGYIKQKYGDSAQLLYTDTDSLILEIFTSNFYEDMKQNIQHFDTSNYPQENIHGMPKTVSVVGKMKDEFKGVPIQSFYGTGAKAYCVKTDKLLKKAKGVSKHVIQQQLHFNDYAQIVENGGIIYRKMYVFISELHTIYTELKNKVALSSQDDKRYIIPNDVKTLAWGHLLINPRNGDLDDLVRGLEDEDININDLNINDLINTLDFDYNIYLQ